MPWQQFKAGRCATKSRQRWMPASRKNAGSLPLLTASARAAFLSRERAGEIFRSPVPTDPRARLSPAGTSTPSTLPGRSELCPAAAHTKACVWPKAVVPHGRAARREDMGGKNLQSVFVPTWNESSTCGGAAPGSISLFLCTIARGPEERFPSSCARCCLQPGSGEEFWTQTLFKKKKKIVSKAIFTYWKISI